MLNGLVGVLEQADNIFFSMDIAESVRGTAEQQPVRSTLDHAPNVHPSNRMYHTQVGKVDYAYRETQSMAK